MSRSLQRLVSWNGWIFRFVDSLIFIQSIVAWTSFSLMDLSNNCFLRAQSRIGSANYPAFLEAGFLHPYCVFNLSSQVFKRSFQSTSTLTPIPDLWMKNYQSRGQLRSDFYILTMQKKKPAHHCTHTTSKLIELESPGWSGLVRF